MDFVNIIDPYYTNEILQEIQSVEIDTGTELQVIIVDNIDHKYYKNPKIFATKLFNQWKIGRPSNQKNNGVLIAVVVKQQRVEIEIGKELNRYMNSDWCTDLLERETVPSFKVEQYGCGLYNAVSDVADRLREVDSDVATPYKRERPITSYSDHVDRIITPFLLVIVGIGMILPKGKNDDDYDDDDDDDGTFSGRRYRGSRSNSESTWSGGSSNGDGGGASW
jgi:uncharacterized protein